MNNYKIEYLILPNGKAPIIEWLKSLDSITRKRINQRILRIEDGNFGDYKKLSDDISELRFTFGKGYRIYYTEENNKIILLINGGDKSKQSKNIEKAQELLEQCFIKALEYAVRAKDSILGISKKTGISRSNLYAIFNGEQQPQLSTALKIIKELGYTVQVA